MNSSGSQIDQKYVVKVNWADRWQVYQRLKELDIPCSCEINQPLQVETAHPLAIVQVWCVLRRFTDCRQEMIRFLENSWHSRY
ncbi:Asr1405/Asl0597 family protein [Nostoc sp. FACHB-110]|uniref:Asr1405/Asl0597 family protein n=1 Tax=Nostoc sp. FACHB-110 TaxID=2692834 RepID=UPI0016822CD0|nr:Asr1405/Asl0597 family protein [Nostoc sp. FACHB-110]MBD2437176.1 hypothetical protein [Nostoc sp. FACHB-110]